MILNEKPDSVIVTPIVLYQFSYTLFSLPYLIGNILACHAQGDQRANHIFETIGCYLGYAIAHYADFYDIKNTSILGLVNIEILILQLYKFLFEHLNSIFIFTHIHIFKIWNIRKVILITHCTG